MIKGIKEMHDRLMDDWFYAAALYTHFADETRILIDNQLFDEIILTNF